MIDDEFEEFDRQFAAINRLTEIHRVKALLREEREDKAPQCTPACAYAGRDPREHDTPRPMMIATAGNKHYKAGTRHMQCEACARRYRRQVDIALSLPPLTRSRDKSR
jgi:hypothetical protein